MAARRGNVGDPTARSSLLDAAQQLMVEEGYAAVTARGVAAKANVNSALVFYYFETMDGLFIALFRARCGAEFRPSTAGPYLGTALVGLLGPHS